MSDERKRTLPIPGDSEQLSMLIESTSAFTEQMVLQNEIQNKQFEILKKIEGDIGKLLNYFENKDKFEKTMTDIYVKQKQTSEKEYINHLKSQTNKVLLAFAGTLGIFAFIVFLIQLLMKSNGG